MDPIYVIGHRNPDTDSIVSAMAYAALRNACGRREYEAGRLGQISAETRIVLNRFGFEAPVQIATVRTQVRDVEFDCPPRLAGAVPVSYAWNMMQENPNLSVLPIMNEDETLYGLITAENIAERNAYKQCTIRSKKNSQAENANSANNIVYPSCSGKKAERIGRDHIKA